MTPRARRGLSPSSPSTAADPSSLNAGNDSEAPDASPEEPSLLSKGAPLPSAEGLRLGAGYWAWLSAAICSEFGSNLMIFAISWTATGFGGAKAGLVTSATMLFRTVLLLAGGSVGDRYGPRRIMILTYSSMLAVTSLAAVWFAVRGPSVASLVVVGAVLGAASAFYMPASGVFPRLFVDDSHLTRVMATTSSGLQLARIAGPALGGVLLAWIGLTWVIAVNAASFLLIVTIVLLVIPPRQARAPNTAHVTLRDTWRSIHGTGQHRILLPILIAFGALVAGTSPSLTLLFPLLARGRGWSSADAGLIEAAFMAAALAVGLTVAARGPLHRAGIALIGGPLLTSAGLLIVAAAPTVWIACVGSAGVGIGLVTFNVHAVPRFLAASPPGAQVRLQAVLGLTVTLPVLILSSLYGLLAQHASPSWALLLATAWTLAAAIIMATKRPF